MLGGGLPVVPYGVDVAHIPLGRRRRRTSSSRSAASCRTRERTARSRSRERAGLPLVIVGDVTPYLSGSAAFYEERVRPHVDGRAVVHHPHASRTRRSWRSWHAREAFLFPISWEEPFGLVVAEAMAAGTPVLATPRGSLPELVEHGVTGFLGETDAELAGFVRELGRIDRAACRRRAEERYSVGRMVGDYEALYARLAGSA